MRKLNGETYNRFSCWYVQLMLCSNVNILHDMYSMLVYHFPTLVPEQDSYVDIAMFYVYTYNIPPKQTYTSKL